MKEDLHGFSTDRSIQTTEDDLLGRSGFACDLAEALASWHGKDSLVVALHGEWGSGKSSIKNMALSELKKMSSDSLGVIDFSPWEWAAQEKITESFFREVSAHIGASDSSKKDKELAQKFKLYGQYLNTGKIVATGVSSSLPFILFVVATIGTGSRWFDETVARNISSIALVILAIGVGLMCWGQSFLNSCSKWLQLRSSSREKGLSELREELNLLLKKRESPLIIILDDLDRLTIEQLRMVFQLVKANSDFPNVVFVLLFQRDLVEEVLSSDGQIGRNYLEKIVQVPFDIPKIEINKVYSVLFKGLDELLNSNQSALGMFNKDYWGNLFHGSMKYYFSSLRDVYRYMSTLSFHFSMLKGRDVFEVNPVDLMGIECIRVFEPDVYGDLAVNKDILTQSNGDYDTLKEKNKTVVEGIINKSSNGKEEVVKEILKTLFPSIEWILGGVTYSGDFKASWLREMRICHPNNFNKFFQFSIPEGELSNSDFKAMLDSTANAKKFENFIDILNEKGVARNAFSQFESFTDEIPLENGDEYLLGLFNVGDSVESESVGFTSLSAHIHVFRLASQFLRRFDDIDIRSNLLERSFEKSNGFSIVESILVADERRREKGEPDILLDDDSYDSLKEMFVKKISVAAEDTPDFFIENKHLVSFLYGWERWGSEDEACSWISSQVSDPTKCIKILKGFSSQVSSHVMGDHIVRVKREIRLSEVEKFMDVGEIKKVLDKIDRKELSPEHKEVTDAFREAVDRRDKGFVDRRS